VPCTRSPARPLSTELGNVGFRDVQETETTLPRMWAGSARIFGSISRKSSTVPLFEAIPERCVRVAARCGLAQQMETG